MCDATFPIRSWDKPSSGSEGSKCKHDSHITPRAGGGGCGPGVRVHCESACYEEIRPEAHQGDIYSCYAQEMTTKEHDQRSPEIVHVLKSQHEPGDNTKLSICNFVMKYRSLSRAYNEYRWRSLRISWVNIRHIAHEFLQEDCGHRGIKPRTFRLTVEHHPNLCLCYSPHIYML